MGDNVRISARDRSSVQNQIGVVRGNAIIHSHQRATPDDLAEQVARLRELLENAIRAGTVDPAPARAELDRAEAALPVGTDEARGRFVLALRRLGVLVTGAGELSAAVAAVIAVVQGAGG